MGYKRPYPGAYPGSHPTEDYGSTNPHDSESSRHTKKKRKNNVNNRHTAKSKEISSNSQFKKRARAIRRLLQKDGGLPANVRNELERELAAHTAMIADNAYRKKRSEMIGRYHMVRFFERQKAERLVKKLKREIETSAETDDIEKLKADLHIAEVDVAYTKYFPFLEPYPGLYPKPKDDEPSGTEKQKRRAALDTPRPPLWMTVEAAMEKGEAELERLRDRRDALETHRPRDRPRPAGHNEAEAEEAANDSGSDDGGFFEED